MGIKENIESIKNLGYQLAIDIDIQGYIIAGVFYKPDAHGMSASVLEPANELGNDLDDVLNGLVKRLLQTIKEQGNA